MRGTSLVESAVILVIVGIAAGLSVPRAIGLRDRLLVRRHAEAVITAYQRARLAALLGSGTALLRIQPDHIGVWRIYGEDSTLLWQTSGPATDGVTVTGPSRLVFAPGGVTMGVANGSFVLSRGGVSRTVVASRLGRLRMAVPRRVRRPRRCEPRCSRSS